MTPLSEVMKLGNKKMGRPTDNPKNTSIKFKADDETVLMLKKCSKQLEVSQAEVLRRGVRMMYDDITK